MKPTYEDHANLIEDVIVRIAASDSPLPKDARAFFTGYVPSIHAAKQEMKELGIDPDSLDVGALTPKHCDMVFSGPRGAVRVASVRRRSYLENQRRRMGSFVDPRPSAVATVTEHYETGASKVVDRISFLLNGNQWWPEEEKHVKVKRTSQKINVISGRWEEWENCESIVTPFCELAAMCEWSRRTCWTVQFGMYDAPSVVTNTDPVGVRELLRMRDVPEGRNRRDALRHWVRCHTRKNRKDASTEHEVRRHLRGTTECDWFGLKCTIVPSPIDEAASSQTKR